MHARQKEFRELQDKLRMRAADVAHLVGRAHQTVLQYRCSGTHGRVPPEGVLATMRAAWEEKQHQNLTDAIELIRSKGWDVDWSRLEETQEEVEAALREHGWRRPSFLTNAEEWKVARTFQGDYDLCDETGVVTYYCARCGGTISRIRVSNGEYRIYDLDDGAYGYAHLEGDRWCYVEGCDAVEEAA